MLLGDTSNMQLGDRDCGQRLCPHILIMLAFTFFKLSKWNYCLNFVFIWIEWGSSLGIPRPFSRQTNLRCVSKDSIRRTTKWHHPYSLRSSFPISYLRMLCGICTGKNLRFWMLFIVPTSYYFLDILFIYYIYIFIIAQFFFGVGIAVMK